MKYKILAIMLLISFLSMVFGLLTTLYIAYLSHKPFIFLTVGGAFYFIINILLLKLILHKYKTKEKTIMFRNGIIISLSIFILSAVPLFLSEDFEQKKTQEIMQQLEFWHLPNGDSIAYTFREAPQSIRNNPPIIFLHGGPGTPDMNRDIEYFSQLTQKGYDVYVYDQIGSGLSDRLDNPNKYSIQRDVDNLEEIRKEINAENIILIGHSYGGEVAANYIANYGNHVTKVVFSSPGAINPEDMSDGTLQNQLSSQRKLILYAELLKPRVLFTYCLLQVNPKAAHAFAGDEEMDARFDKVYKITQSALHAEGKSHNYPIHNLGFFANQTPQSWQYKQNILDPRNQLANWNGEALIIKGDQDYLSDASAEDYEKAIERSILNYLKDAGHNVYQDRPEKFMEMLNNFLSNN
ncbi:alpha/beta hydrolase [Bacillus anthracis]|uniref:alpha/beta fold hydrolase n=1 Tax=Bacillus anthracis TaxID=1392 RepID=UPI002DBD3471|nr:alpha/beta hydrolase [Bacillus anthracis]MEB9507353.1 alpha/beta hydrolase [Bacillus anthracis]